MLQLKNSRAVRVTFAIVAIGVAFLFLPIKQWLFPLQDQIRNMGELGPVVVVAGYILFTMLLIPGSALTAFAGSTFGLWKGLIVVVIGANSGALCSFLLARTFLRQKVVEWAAQNPRFMSLDRAVGREGFKIILLSRLSPIFPFTLLNYLLGLTTVKIGVYMMANLIGMLPGTFLYVYLGVTAQKALTGNKGLLSATLGLAATIAVVVTVTRMARKAIAEVDDDASLTLNVHETRVRNDAKSIERCRADGARR